MKTLSTPELAQRVAQELSAPESQTRAVIEFNTVGRKTLILEYAKLEVAG